MPVRVIVTAGSVADCTQAGELIAGFSADHLIAGKGYDTNAIVGMAEEAGMWAEIAAFGGENVLQAAADAATNLCRESG